MRAASPARCASPRSTGRASTASIFANTREEAAAIGFDDEFLYDEIPKPIEDRAASRPKHLALPEAKAVFAEWQAKPDKVEYRDAPGGARPIPNPQSIPT